jgi:cytochrome d ubiquinol oxidase subunit I
MRNSVILATTQLDLARLQFAATSIYHFLFVPVTIGLAVLVAVLQTVWHRGGDEDYLRLTRFFGTLLLINVAVGVVTGLVQEFQFGMAWSSYSRFVGDVFGAPLAIEGLAAFFLESTFLGLWLFGWGRLPKAVHLATIWLVAFGTVLSAAIILAANSWMQHPVGDRIDPVTGRAQLTSIFAVLLNPLFLWAFAHTLLAALVTAAALMLAVSAWHLMRHSDHDGFRKTARLSLAVLLPAAFLVMIVGSELGVAGETYQPMKIAAGEALWNTEQPASFTLFQIGGFSASRPKPSFAIKVPHLLSFLATNSWSGKVPGINQVNAQEQQKYGAGDYVPNVFINFWSIRGMAYLAGLEFLLALWGLWALRRSRATVSPWFLRIAVWAVVLPFIMNTLGWVLTEVGRQPWIVQGLQLTRNAVSPSVSAATIAISLVLFVLLYGLMAIIDAALMIRFARQPLGPPPALDEQAVPVPAMTY